VGVGDRSSLGCAVAVAVDDVEYERSTEILPVIVIDGVTCNVREVITLIDMDTVASRVIESVTYTETDNDRDCEVVGVWASNYSV